MAHVQTVLGPIDPADLGFTLPHEHTQIALWHVPRPVGLLAAHPRRAAHPRGAGGLPGGWRRRPGRPDARRRRARPGLAGRDRPGRPGCTSSWAAAGIAAPTTRPRRASTGGPSTTSPTSWSARRPTASATRASGRASSARSARTSHGSRRSRSGSIGRPRGPRGGRASRSPPTVCCRRSVSTSCGSSRTRASTRRGSSSATPIPSRGSTTTSPSWSAGRASSSTSSACRSRPVERLGEGRVVELLCDLLGRGHVERILLSQDVCHDSQLARYGGNGYTYLARTFLPRLREAGVGEAEIDTMTVANPRRMLAIG